MSTFKTPQLYGYAKDDRRKKRGEESVPLPVRGGRSSVSEEHTTLAGLIAAAGAAKPEFATEFLEVLNHLAMWDGDVSYAADNIVQLGSTDHIVYFDDEVPDAVQKKAMAHLTKKRKYWYAYGSGIDSLIADLLWQIVTTGARSAEIIPDRHLEGVHRIVLVHPKRIRFIYNKDTDNYDPFQQVVSGATTAQSLRRLNPATYKYGAIRRSNDRPYAIPPFLSVLDELPVTRDMKKNFAGFMKKFGSMGFLEALVNPLTRNTGESDESWYARNEAFLAPHAARLKNGVTEGFVMGFKGGHEFNFHSAGATAATGVKELFELQATAMAAGLKQDPVMIARNFSTTETLGRVILAKLTKQVTGFQRMVADFLEQVYVMELALAGFPIATVTVEFDEPMLGDAEKEEAAYGKKIENMDNLYKQGVISQSERAQSLGYSEPDQDEPREVVDPNAAAAGAKAPAKKPANGRTAPSGGTKTNLASALAELNAHLPEYPYDTDHNCGDASLMQRFDRNEDIDRFVRNYFRETRTVYSAAVAKVVRRIAEEIAKMGANATLESVHDRALYHLFTMWDETFRQPQTKVTEKWVQDAYNFFRAGKVGQGRPDSSTFTQRDLRTIAWLKENDNLYLGKFITDEDTRRRFFKMLEEEYLNKGLPIGDNAPEYGKFEEFLGDLLLGEEWKIERIIATTLNKARNYAAVTYMATADVEQFIIRGISDRLQCGWCKHMNGKTFSVATAVSRIEEETANDPSAVKLTSPFANAVYKKVEDMDGLTDDQLQASGIMVPFHPRCRCTVVAKL